MKPASLIGSGRLRGKAGLHWMGATDTHIRPRRKCSGRREEMQSAGGMFGRKRIRRTTSRPTIRQKPCQRGREGGRPDLKASITNGL